MVYNKALQAKGCTDAAVVVELKLIADREHGFDDRGIVGPAPFS